MEKPTRYQCLFGSPEEMAMYIVDHCPYDCYECMMPSSIPCDREFGITTDNAEKYYQKILNWLNASYNAE